MNRKRVAQVILSIYAALLVLGIVGLVIYSLITDPLSTLAVLGGCAAVLLFFWAAAEA